MTTREPLVDEFDRTLIDVWLDWRADIHTCGRPLSESLLDDENPDDPDYQIGVETCRACMAIDRFMAQEAKDDEELIKGGRHPQSWRLHRAVPFAELPPETQQVILAERQRKQNERRRPP